MISNVQFDKNHHDILVDLTSLYLFHDIIPLTRPYVTPPSVKTNTLEIPGAHGEIDLSTIMTGYPIYGRRTGSWEFMIMYDRPDANNRISLRGDKINSQYVWLDRYNHLLSLFSRNYGKTQIILSDSVYVDTEGNIDESKCYYYQGALSVGSYKPGNKYSTITVNYNLDPFRYAYKTVSEINPDKFKQIEINSSELKDILTVDSYDMLMYSNYFKGNSNTLNPASESVSQPVYPKISVWSSDGNPIEVGFVNTTLGMNRTETFVEGVHEAYRFTITPGCKFMAKGNGAVKIDWRNRSL